MDEKLLDEIRSFIRSAYGSNRAYSLPPNHFLGLPVLRELQSRIRAEEGIEMPHDKEMTLEQYATEFNKRLSEREARQEFTSQK